MAKYRYIVPAAPDTAAPDLESAAAPTETVVGSAGVAAPKVRAGTLSIGESSALELSASASGGLLVGGVPLAPDYPVVVANVGTSSSVATYGDTEFRGDYRSSTPHFWTVVVGGETVYTHEIPAGAEGDQPAVVCPVPLSVSARQAMVDAGATVVRVNCGDCLRPGTPVRMADGSERRIEDVREGDLVASVAPDGTVVPDRVRLVSRGSGAAWDEWTFSDGRTVGTVGRHRFWNSGLGEFMYLEAWNPGERAVSFTGASSGDGAGPALVSRVRHGEASAHCTLFTERFENYFAAGLLAGNRRSGKVRWS